MRYGVPDEPEQDASWEASMDQSAPPPAILGSVGDEPEPLVAAKRQQPKEQPPSRSRRPGNIFFAAGE